MVGEQNGGRKKQEERRETDRGEGERERVERGREYIRALKRCTCRPMLGYTVVSPLMNEPYVVLIPAPPF